MLYHTSSSLGENHLHIDDGQFTGFSSAFRSSAGK